VQKRGMSLGAGKSRRLNGNVGYVRTCLIPQDAAGQRKKAAMRCKQRGPAISVGKQSQILSGKRKGSAITGTSCARLFHIK